MTEDEFRALALAFPGAREAFTIGSPVFKVSGKVLARSLGDQVVLRGLPVEEVEFLVEADPELFSTTGLHKPRGRVLAKLSRLDVSVARGFLDRRFRQIAKASVLRLWDRPQ